ncbi:hypothetical protein OG946_25215 [Streptomyces sp. NBC_01808]|uniref:hypothetical protein n=1 Tax=Streptomyces sp. NBC_01808 TaxID=2975947 RepID=UPI002DDBD9AD|nr:hypothetical protein [Streptomyces sp. NBC_01808]WSA40377.1 hypothetical protein OG946_25215 [Streptomyces sp. NBC_01808]
MAKRVWAQPAGTPGAQQTGADESTGRGGVVLRLPLPGGAGARGVDEPAGTPGAANTGRPRPSGSAAHPG